MPRVRRQRRNAYERLRSLAAYRSVRTWLLAGVLPRDIAVWIRGQDECRDIAEASLIRTLQRLRRDLTPSEDERSRLIDELIELKRLFHQNEARLATELRREKELGRLLETTREVVALQADLLTRRAQIKLRLGLEPRL